MDINENGFTPKPVKQSPFADSPYESAYIEPQVQPTVPQAEYPKPAKRGGGFLRTLLAIVLAIGCSGITGTVVGGIWQDRFTRMETAMDEKFAALKQLYSEKQTAQQPQNTPVPNQGPKTPSEVYAQNVEAVVAVIARYESGGSYGESSGSGFIISADGYVVTNYHVIQGATQISIMLNSGDTLAAEVVGHESTNDVALLKMEAEDLPYVTIGSSDALVVGDQVAAIGNPLGELTATLTVGYISAKDRILNTDGTVINMLQTDAAINSGNSGGPLFNMNGEVVGITTAKYSGSSNSGASIEGLGFAIPMDDVAGILSDLKEFGYVTGAYLGVYVRDVDASAQSYGLPAGAYVEEVTPGTAAEKAGIRAGDIIINLGGYDVDSLNTLTRVLRRFKAGETVSVTVYRNGSKEYLSITLDEKPVETQQQPTEQPTVPDENDYSDWPGFFFPW